ncbi:MAG: hypothetical protein HY813_00530 [Candidatus Portnoybacteria bacterium]|nr:hypothetical protein [Candidatus Portnoybacteria bacterium]
MKINKLNFKMSNYKKIQIVARILLLVLISYPVIVAEAMTCPMQYGGSGCGWKGGGVGPSGLMAVSCRQCACWCGHVSCCYPKEGEFPKAVGPTDWLFNISTKQCNCASGGGQSQQQQQKLQQQQQRQTGQRPTNSQLQRSASNTANKANAGKWDCSKFAQQYRIENGGMNPGRSTVDMYDAGEGWDVGDPLNRGDILVTSGRGLNGMHAVTCYNANCLLVIHKPGVNAAVRIVDSARYQNRALAVVRFK